ncbi:MAG: lysylphosphatidylglycerol synthase transmembrane domain-containing protein [Acidimicrobiia bacterium]|nr:lysylphosphatidylglycerol synthase transmembrane domain-containing protein [Acidimicrobiia bacterium]
MTKEEPDERGGVPATKPRWRRALGVIASLAIVSGLLVGVLPAIADFGEVWSAIQSLTWMETVSLLLAAAWNILTYQFIILAALPGLTLLRAFVVGQISTAVTNTLPAGSAIGVGVTYTMFSSFGFDAGSIAIAAVVTGLWNTFVKLGLPVIALAILTIGGSSNPALQSAAVTGVAVLAGAVVLLALVLSSEAIARTAGDRLGAVVSRVARPFRLGPYRWGDGFAAFRAQSVDLLRRRWLAITAATLVSHLSLFFLLLLSLRHVGVPATDVSGPEALAAFALVRLVTAVPITPGNLGIVEVGLTAALVVAGGDESLVVAAVLIYRALSYVLQIPLGLVAYVIWQTKRSWRTAPAD